MLQAESSGQTELTASRSCPGMRSLSLTGTEEIPAALGLTTAI